MKFQRGSIFRPEKDYYKFAGIILFIGCIQFLLAVELAQTQFPGYNMATNTLSDLGGGLSFLGPSAAIFNLSITILGFLFLASVYLILKSGGCRLFSSCLAIFGICAVGMGLFPEYTGGTHFLFSLLALIFGSLAVLFSYRLGINIPMVVVSMIIGIITLIIILSELILGFGDSNPFVAYLGVGGAEYFIIYPVLIYLTALGGYLTSRGKDWVKIRFTGGYW